MGTPKPVARRGRPPVLTPELTAKIVECLKDGNFREPSAKFAGTSMRTFRHWMQRGKEEESGIYRDFYNAVIEAENYAETKAVRAILKTGEKDAKYLQWWLERKFPERWGRVNDTLRALHDELKALKARIDAQA